MIPLHEIKTGWLIGTFQNTDRKEVEKLLQNIEPTLIGQGIFPQSEGLDNEPKTTQLMVTHEDNLVAYAIVRQESEKGSDRFVWILVNPAVRRQRLASQVLQHILKNCITPEVSKLTTWAMAEDPAGSRFAEGAGFEKSHSSSRKVLPIGSFDFEPFKEELLRFEGSGYRIYFLKNALPDSELDRQKLYHLTVHGLVGAPGNDSPFSSFERFCDTRSKESGFHAIAIHGEEWVGLTSLRRIGGPERLHHTVTAVLPSHRRKGIGTMVKLAAIAAAEKDNVKILTTGNHLENKGMLKINERLGYRTTAERNHYHMDWPAGR
jgi:GNAT superfamily N-acetyltransferase